MNHRSRVAPEHREAINQAGAALDELMKGYGFILVAFDMEKKDGMHFCSNIPHPVALDALREFIGASQRTQALEKVML